LCSLVRVGTGHAHALERALILETRQQSAGLRRGCTAPLDACHFQKAIARIIKSRPHGFFWRLTSPQKTEN